MNLTVICQIIGKYDYTDRLANFQMNILKLNNKLVDVLDRDKIEVWSIVH